MALMTKATFKAMADSVPQLRRGRVWCVSPFCGKSQQVDPVHCLQHGWPICCGRTMTIESDPQGWRHGMKLAIFKWRNARAIRRLYFEYAMERFYEPVALRDSRLAAADRRRHEQGVGP